MTVRQCVVFESKSVQLIDPMPVTGTILYSLISPSSLLIYNPTAACTPEGVVIVGIGLELNRVEFYVINNAAYSPIQSKINSVVPPNAGALGNSVSMSKNGKHVAMSHIYNSAVYVYERKPCHSSCATCSGPNANECTSCIFGGLTGNPGTCTYTCNSNCLDCALRSTTKCATCNQASSTKYFEPSTLLCVACD